MLRLVVLALLVTVTPAFAQWSAKDLEGDVKQLETRYVAGYERALKGRDFFASIHDAIWHPAYKAMTSAKAAYDTARAKYDTSFKAGDMNKARKDLDEVERTAKALDGKTNAYVTSSSGAVEKIQIGLGVFLFAIAGGVFLIFRRRKTA